jgi:hypothetical protein
MRLTELWNQKPEVSAKQIAVILSTEYDARITENAVLGKVHRLRLVARAVAVRATRKNGVPSLPVVTVRRDVT